MKRTKKLLTGFIICMALAGGISISQRVQAAEDDFIIQDEVSLQDGVSDSAIQNEVTKIENVKDEVFPRNDVDNSQDRATSDEDDFLTGYVGYTSGDVLGEFVGRNLLRLYKYNGNDADVIIPDGIQGIHSGAFKGCTNLKSVTLPDSMVEIGQGAFEGCTNLKSITLPDSVIEVQRGAFIGCSQLQEINVGTGHPIYSSNDGILYSKDKSILEIYPTGKSNDFTIPSNVVKINIGAFYGCNSLINISIPNGVEIGNGAFYKCSSLENITIADGVTEIANNTFSGCTNLTSIIIPDSVTLIGGSAFSDCNNLRDVKIPDSVTKIGGSTFSGCTCLTNVAIPDNVTEIGGSAFYGCTSLKNITIPNSVMDIGNHAFGNCTNLSDIVISNSAANIGYGVFRNTPWLENKKKENPNQPLIVNNILLKAQIENGTFVIPNGVTSICADAFDDCDFIERENVTEITIPSSVVSIGENAFAGCDNLREITILNPRAKLGYNMDVLDFGDGPTYFKNPVVIIKGYKGSSAEELVDYKNQYGGTQFKFVPLDGTGGNTPKPSVTPKPTKPKTPNKGTVLKSKNTTYKVTKKGSEVAFTKISSAAASVSIPATVKISGITYKVTSISPNAFKGNKKLSKVTIGANITSIGKNAFNGCKNLKSIIIKTTKLKNVGQNAFKGIKSTAKIKVPSKQLKAYKKLLKGKGQGKKVRISK